MCNSLLLVNWIFLLVFLVIFSMDEYNSWDFTAWWTLFTFEQKPLSTFERQILILINIYTQPRPGMVLCKTRLVDFDKLNTVKKVRSLL